MKGVFWSYNPLILTFYPNFLARPSTSPPKEKKHCESASVYCVAKMIGLVVFLDVQPFLFVKGSSSELRKTNWKFFCFRVLCHFLSSLYTSLFSTWNNKKQASNSQLTTHGSTRNLAKLQTPMRLDGKEVFSSSVLSISEGGTRGLCYKSWFIWFNRVSNVVRCQKTGSTAVESWEFAHLNVQRFHPPPQKKKHIVLRWCDTMFSHMIS